ncbi:MAG: inorganic diphosphatase [Candidatus Micrarchaeota archaeon]|nr:inorganic diphosphatase [Candidatus Micrarchaeota archaeon]
MRANNEEHINSRKFIGKTVSVTIDRPLGSRHPKHDFIYPINYGYVKREKSADGEDIDAYVLGVFKPINSFRGRCIAIIVRTEDNDDKLIVVPFNKAYLDEQIKALTEFQEQWFKIKIFRKADRRVKSK